MKTSCRGRRRDEGIVHSNEDSPRRHLPVAEWFGVVKLRYLDCIRGSSASNAGDAKSFTKFAQRRVGERHLWRDRGWTPTTLCEGAAHAPADATATCRESRGKSVSRRQQTSISRRSRHSCR